MDEKAIMRALQKEYKEQRKEYIEYTKDRDWKDLGYDSPAAMLDDCEPGDDEGHEACLWEQGYLKGISEAMRIIREIGQKEQTTV